ncbi:MAG TPA: hypothetical protein IAA06_04230 [Candidatus Blautia faecavium]|uniref:Uncharacterized protein n=1 Tax=Candidatus Blautia faecavium TaxID=2838487 RepID=A0A9D2LRX6_9FIRM|nr:hypothetical protein [Candidatus Blautia faecavium]
MMYHKICLSLLTASFLLAGAPVSVFAESEENLPESLEEIEDSISLNVKSLLDSFDAVGNNVSMHYEDGSVYSYYCYYTDDTYVLEDSDSYIEAVSDDTNYFYDPGTDTPGRFLFLTEEAYEDYIQSGYDVGSYTFENETMISITEEDGKIALVTQCSEEKAAEFITELGYEPQEGDVVQWRYQIDPENSFITSSSSVLIRNDGTETTLSEESLNTEPEEYVFSSEITERLDSEDSRTVTIITNPGTDQEAVFQETVGKGCSVVPIGYNNVLYTDEACTEEFSSNSDTESDVTLYAITNETDEETEETVQEESEQ